MDKVLVVLSDNNKGKFISKGFSDAFRGLSYFVIEKKIYDLNIDEVKAISPNLIFLFWTDMTQKDILEKFISEYQNDDVIYIHCSELSAEIPENYKKLENHYIFTTDSKTKKHLFKPSVNPKEYKTKFKGYKYNITFSGNPAYKGREEILTKLIYNFGPINIFCRSFDFYKSVDEIEKSKLLDKYMIELYRSSYKGYVENAKELSDIYVSSRINVDIENENKKAINYRCLEIMASGGFLIAPYTKSVIKFFEEGKEFETYKNSDELVDKINFYMKNLNIAQLIADKGKKNTVSNNSFYDRLKSMLKVIYGKDFSSR